MPIFTSDWEAVLRTLVVGALAYVTLIVLLRLAGKRTIARWNAFDFIVTVTLGSTLASALISKSVGYEQAAVAFALLIGLQFVIAFLSVRSRWVEGWVKARPTFLLRGGAFHEETMRRERVTRGEVLAAIRTRGIASVEDVEAVVLETDGTFSVIKKTGGSPTALEDVAV